MRGRKPTPTKLKLITGNPGHRPLPPDEPQPPSEIPKCPRHLDKEARKEWRRITGEFKELGVITKLDMAVLAQYCEAYSKWAQAERMIQEKGMIFTLPAKTKTFKDGTVEKSGGGFPIMNPYFHIANKAKDQMIKAAIELGITPSSRSRVKSIGPKVKEENVKERFFK